MFCMYNKNKKRTRKLISYKLINRRNAFKTKQTQKMQNKNHMFL